MRSGTAGEFLADAGAVVGGGAALGATVGFVLSSSTARRIRITKTRARVYVALVPALIVLYALLELIQDWSKLATYAAAAGFLVVSLILTMIWVEMAPDGALRRRPRS